MDERMTRRLMLQVAGTAGVAGLAGSAVAADDQPSGGGPAVQLGEPEVVTPQLLQAKNISTNVSPDKLAITVLADALRAEDGPDMAAKTFRPHVVAVINIPLDNPEDEQLVGVTVDLRGHVDKTAGAKGVIAANIWGTVEAIEFDFGREMGDNFSRRLFRTVPQPDPLHSSGKLTVGHLPLVLMLSILRTGPTEAAVLSIDSVDVEATRRGLNAGGGGGKQKRPGGK